MTIEVIELTPPGAGGVSVIRVSGSGAFDRVLTIAPRIRANVPAPQLARLRIGAEDMDEALVCVLSCTEIELHVHGSPPLVKRLVECLTRHGAEHFGRVELDEETDVGRSARGVEARATELLSRTMSDSGARILLDQAAGALRAAMYALQYARANERSAAIEELIAHGRVARFAIEPVEVVLAGAVNAGKSTLFNLLLGEDRVIVSDEEGTTRDVVRERAQIGAYPIVLCDSAGERESQASDADHLLEQASQRHAIQARTRAELVLWLVRADSAARQVHHRGLSTLPHADPESTARERVGRQPVTDRSLATDRRRVPFEIVYTQVDRIDPAMRGRYASGISALHDPETARSRVRAIFQAAFELPDEPWSAGRAVAFDRESMQGLRALELDALPAAWMRAIDMLFGTS